MLTAILANYIRGLANRTGDESGSQVDRRNYMATKALDDLAGYVEELPPSDSRLATFQAAGVFTHPDVPVFREHALRMIRQYGSLPFRSSPDRFLSEIAEVVAHEGTAELVDATDVPELGE